jgi:transcriptional regulator with XRE-family HTH domain
MGAPGFSGRRLRDARRAARLTQRQLAEQLGIPDTGVINWETGQRAPRTDRLPELARILGVQPADLTDTEDTQEPSLVHLRIAVGLLQEHVADHAGLTRTKYSALERGEIATLSDRDARALAKALRAEPVDVRAAHAVGRAAYLARRSV